jgi:UDP:flavonoid glycosyltransferase YjiC (YdhE family)
VRLALRRLLSDRGYAERAGELGEWAKRHDGAQTAADVLEEFAGGSGRLRGWDSNPQPIG